MAVKRVEEVEKAISAIPDTYGPLLPPAHWL